MINQWFTVLGLALFAPNRCSTVVLWVILQYPKISPDSVTEVLNYGVKSRVPTVLTCMISLVY